MSHRQWWQTRKELLFFSGLQSTGNVFKGSEATKISMPQQPEVGVELRGSIKVLTQHWVQEYDKKRSCPKHYSCKLIEIRMYIRKYWEERLTEKKIFTTRIIQIRRKREREKLSKNHNVALMYVLFLSPTCSSKPGQACQYATKSGGESQVKVEFPSFSFETSPKKMLGGRGVDDDRTTMKPSNFKLADDPLPFEKYREIKGLYVRRKTC